MPRPTQRPGALLRSFGALLAFLPLALPAWAQGPVIDVWYGGTQEFGHLGNPQYAVNVLGSAADQDGLLWLSYALNGGPPQLLRFGPDSRRLLEPGDFNVEINHSLLLPGRNDVAITAFDKQLNTSVATVALDYVVGQSWPGTCSATWSEVDSIQAAAQIVDGRWELVAGGVRPSVLGYDRTLVIGDQTWTSYEATVPVTLNAIDPAGFAYPSVSPAFGIGVRWLGHHTLEPGEQPLVYWVPQGASVWYDFGLEKLSLLDFAGFSVADPKARKLALGIRYWWKVRVQGLPSGQATYALKAWADGTPEPASFELVGTKGASGVQSGSLLFVAHHVDATIGDVVVRSLVDSVAPAPPTGVVAQADGDARIDIAWVASDDADLGGYRVYRGASPDFAPSAASRVASGLAANAFSDVDLAEATTYYYQVTAVDETGNESEPSLVELATTTADTTPPAIAALGAPTPTCVELAFDEDVDASSASNPRRYALLPGPYAVLSATLAPDQRTVALVTEPLPDAVQLTLAVTGVLDLAATPNAGEAQAAFRPDLRAHWPLDAGTGAMAADQSGGAHHGAVIGAAWTSASGDGSQSALVFDGTSGRVDVGAPSLEGSQLTLALWLRFDGMPAGASEARLFSQAVGLTEPGHQLALDVVATTAAAALRLRLRAGGETTSLVALDTPLEPGAWHHAAATYDGAFMRLYVDGGEVASAPKTGALGPALPAALGNQPSGAGERAFLGALDDVRLFRRALEAAEVADLGGTQPPLVGSLFGSATLGSLGEPAIEARSELLPGASFELTAANLPPATLAFIALAAKKKSPALDLSNGLLLNVGLPVLLVQAVVTDSSGRGTHVLSLPGNTVGGLPVYVQALALDGVDGAQFASSRGLQIVLP